MSAVTLPEIQRTSLVGCVLYLKTMSRDIDVLTFDFLDRLDMAVRLTEPGFWARGWD